MPTFEKRAWLTLGVVGLTLATYSILGVIFGFGQVAFGAFALIALTTCFSPSSFPRKRAFVDERDREILNNSLRIGMGVLWLAFVAGVMAIGFQKGWDAVLQIHMWVLSALVYVAWVVVLTAQSVTTIVLYRRGQ